MQDLNGDKVTRQIQELQHSDRLQYLNQSHSRYHVISQVQFLELARPE